MKKIWMMFLVSCLAASALAQDFTGVQPAALDQPRIYMNVRRQPYGPALQAKVQGQSSPVVECFLDTGASCIVLSANTAKAFGLQYEKTTAGTPVKFEDVGVGGSESFGVTEPVYISTASYSGATDGGNPAEYSPPLGPFRCEMRASTSLLEMVVGDLDVVGTPAILHHVMVMDVRPVNTVTDKMKTSLVLPGSRDIPAVDEHIHLTPISFAEFTQMIPAGAQPPALAPNFFIGPDPLRPGDRTPPVIVQYHGKSAPITMLLDTGAVTSMISRKTAAALGVTYSADDSTLVGIPADQQFSLEVGGFGGQKTAKGFYLDVMQISTDKVQPMRYLKAPVLVSDITTVTDPSTGQKITLDGVFGMNYLVASCAITSGIVPDIGNTVAGPFSFVVIDPDHGVMGLQNAKH